MRLREAVASIAVLALGSAAAAAEEPDALMWLELPAHRALAEMRATHAPLAPFETDGCSGGLSAVWSVVAERFPAFAEAHGARAPWEACCVAHDRLYHAAGPAAGAVASYEARLDADRQLRACVEHAGEDRVPEIAALYDVGEDRVREGYDLIGRAMYLAVRLGGAPCSGLPWRWGYGYPDCVVSFVDVTGDP